jgi:hypothetical protein
MAKELDARLQTLQEENDALRKELGLANGQKPELPEREAIQLRRLKHLHGRVLNAQVCDECRKGFDSILEDAKWIKK